MTGKTPQSTPAVWLSAGIVPVLTGEPHRFLILRVFKYWDFPKGLVERGEDPLQAACRELKEETGLTDASFDWGRDFFETPPYRGGKIARYYLARVESDKVVLGMNPEFGHAEHHEYRWVTADEALTLLGPRVAAVLGWAAAKI